MAQPTTRPALLLAASVGTTSGSCCRSRPRSRVLMYLSLPFDTSISVGKTYCEWADDLACLQSVLQAGPAR